MIHKVTGKQHNSRMCFVCGMKNRYGLSASFYETETNELVAIIKPGQEHQGYPGRLHGGIAAAVLDETIGRTVTMGREKEVWGVTVEFKIKYIKPIPLEDDIKVIAKLIEDKRIFKGTGKIILSNGEVAAEAEGKYLRLPIERIADFDKQENEWKVIPSSNDPETIEF
ncbi:MAG: PaaI family thioesterase [Candidatus Humimicrobiaceae bacterium]